MPLIETYYKEFPRENICEILDILTGYPESELLIRNFLGNFIVRISWCIRYSPWKISERNWISWKNVLGQTFHWKYFHVKFPVSMSWSYLSVRDFPKNISEMMDFPKGCPQWELSVRNFIGEISVRNSVGMYWVWRNIPVGKCIFYDDVLGRYFL